MKTCGKCKVKQPVEGFWKNQTTCIVCQKLYRLLHRDPMVGRELAWKNGIAKYGVSVEDWDIMFAQQGGVCAICKQVDQTGIRLSVDHDHVTGVVRGLLCRNCNVALGLFKDDPERITVAVSYLAARNG